MPADPGRRAAEPLTVNLIVQMAGMHKPDGSDENYSGDLTTSAQSFCEYFVHNLQQLVEPRGGDLLVVVVLSRGDERAGHQYREGRYLPTGEAATPAPDSGGAG